MNKSKSKVIWQDIAPLTALLKMPGRRIVLLSHLNPDGDSLGSALALLKLLRKLGHHCEVISPNEFPDFLKWLPGSDEIIVFRKAAVKASEILSNAEIIYCIDFNELKRVKELMELVEASSAFKVMIDHHPDPMVKADCILSDVTASSTAELVYRYLQESGFNNLIDNDIASCLFTGIMTDTGCFSYNSSSRNTWETVASLLDFGIDKDRIYSLTYDNNSLQRMRLLGYCLNEKLEVFTEYRTGIITISKEDQKKYHFEVGDSEGFVNYPLSIKGIRFSALFIEKEDHVRISFRSKGSFPVNEFSKKNFNGGGHRNASGGESPTNLTEAVQQFRQLLPLYKEMLCADEL
jgi:phosphoesterase RecJ-like protein